MSVNPSGRDFQFAILGAGALGSILGAHLVEAGHSVAMLARGQRADAVEKSGLAISGLAELTTAVTVLRDPAALRSADVLIIATKTPGTQEALTQLRHVDIGLAFSIQNGTLKDDLLVGAFGRDRVLGALADTSGELLSDGRVLFTRNVKTLLGELSGSLSPRATELAATIDSAGVRTLAVTNILSLEWSKFVSWVGMVTLAVLTQAVTWRYFMDPDTALVLVRLTREMGKLAAALGIELTDEAILPAASLCRGSEADVLATIASAGRAYESGAPEHRMSSLQDWNAGRPLEIHETLGYALQKGAEVGVAMPLLDGFYRVICAAERIRKATRGA